MARRGVSIALACRTFGVSETCYRYAPKLVGANEEIADLLVGLTNARRSWGFGLRFLYLRHVQGRRWNHKRVYRIYRELELNLRIKPRKRLQRDKPGVLTASSASRRSDGSTRSSAAMLSASRAGPFTPIRVDATPRRATSRPVQRVPVTARSHPRPAAPARRYPNYGHLRRIWRQEGAVPRAV